MPNPDFGRSLGAEMRALMHESAHPDAQTSPREDEEARVYFANVWDFVYRWLRHMYKRPTGPTLPFRWDSDWFRCPEVVSRLTEIWRVWEMARVDSGSMMAVWWRDFCDPAMDRIMNPDGPFRSSAEKTGQGEPLGCNRPPDGQFIDERTGGHYHIPEDDSLI